MSRAAAAEDLAAPATDELSSDMNRIVRIRGILVDDKQIPAGKALPGMPTYDGKAIGPSKVISNCLMVGICPVSRSGQISQLPRESRPVRRKSATGGPTAMLSSLNTRESMAAKGRGSVGELDFDPVVSLTSGMEQFFDWSICKPGHRQGSVTELGDNKFSVEIQGEPCIWIFSRAPVSVSRARTATLGPSDPANNFFVSAARNSFTGSREVYLLEVHYLLRLEAGRPIFATLPRHLYGELARTPDGCAILDSNRVIAELLFKTRSDETPSTSLRAALWALGHIGASECGYAAIMSVDPTFVEWCILGATSHANLSIRGIFFHVLGLLSRTHRGAAKLAHLRWDSSPAGSSSAVAVPRDPSVLFQQDSESNFDPSFLSQPMPTAFSGLVPYLPSSNSGEEILNLIAKVRLLH